MTTKEYLGKISRLERMIDNKYTEILKYKELAHSVAAIHYDVRVKSTPNFDRMGTAVAKIEAMERELDLIIDQFVDEKNYIISQIDAIEDEMHYQVLFARYIQKKTFERIAEELNYSLRQISRVHDRALADFERRYGEEYLEK